MLDPETTLDTVGKASEAATKFQEILLKVFGPRWTKKQADADAYADQRKLQTIRDNPDMEIVYTADGMNARARTPEAIAYRAEVRLLNDVVREQENIESVFEAAASEVEQITESNEKTVEDDWIVRFTSIVKDISDKDMQRVWAKILAGEIEKPGRFSLRTLDVIRNLSQVEATTFQKITPYVIQTAGDHFITNESSMYEKYGITFGDLILLDECGLISSTGLVSMTRTIAGEQGLIAYTKEKMLLLDKAQSFPIKVTFGIHSLTNAGKELFQIIDTTPNEEYFLDFTKHIFKENSNCTLSIHKVNAIWGEKINYSKKALQTFGAKEEAH